MCKTLSEKYTKAKSTGGVVQVVKCLPSKFKALSSNPVQPKIINQKRKKKEKISNHLSKVLSQECQQKRAK
jgi:hypothetical protein